VLNRRVVALSPKGEIKWVIGKSDEGGKIVSYFGLPRSIAEDKKGRLYITDTFRHTIVILDKKGKLIAEVGERGVEDGKFNFPEGIAITSEGVIYVDDRENNRLQAIRISSFPKLPTAALNKYKSSFKKFK
jgi:DNA-binding beta-propeller fold protein YncE